MLLPLGGIISNSDLCCQLQMSSNFSNIDSSPCFQRPKLFINLLSNINILLTKSRRGSEINWWKTGNVNFFKSKSSHLIHVQVASQMFQNILLSLLYDVFSCQNRNPIIWKKLKLMPGIRNLRNQVTLKRKNLDPMVNIPKNYNGNRQFSKVD